MKKLFAILLVVCMLTGCTNGGEKDDPEKKDYHNATALSDFDGAKIAVQTGTIHAEVIGQVNNVKVSDYPTYNELLVALKSGVVDGIVADEPQAIATCGKDDAYTYIKLLNNKTGFTVAPSTSGVAIGVQEGSPLRDEINSVLNTITVEQTDTLMEQVIAVSQGQTIDGYVLSCEEPAAPKGTLKIAMEACSEPFNWTDMTETFGAVPICSEGAEGTYANGFDVQLAKYVAAKLGYKLEVYAIEWDSLIPAVQTGVVDAIVSSMSPTDVREEVIDFTKVYYDINLVIMIQK